MITTHFDLGIKILLKDWKNFFSKKYLLNDLMAGTAVACIALPLSLAIALASGVAPEIGLITAIVAGIVCALFGGVPLAVSGPAAAMAVLVATIVQDYGFPALLLVVLGCGFLQFLTGIFGLGTLIKFVPVPVIMGFTAGIGAIILIGQFPRVLGLPAPYESNILSVIVHINSLLHQTKPLSFLLAFCTMLIAFFMPRYWPKLPAPLFAVLLPSLFAYFANLPVETVGQIPSSLPMPKLPSFNINSIEWIDLIGSTFAVYALASLETLLSAGSVDQLSKSKPHDPNQELIGQGLGNLVSALFGGIVVTAVIARSALNVHAGAKTRRAAIIHALFLLATVYLFSPMMSKIPIAVLSGLLMTIALRMVSPHEFLSLWQTSRHDALIYLVTFVMIIIFGLMSGIQVGILVALILAALRLSQVTIQLHITEHGPSQLSLRGPLTFLSATKLSAFEKNLDSKKLPKGIIIDLTRVKALDASGARHLISFVEQLQSKNIKSVLYVIDDDYIHLLKTIDKSIATHITSNELEMESILGIDHHHHELTFDRLIFGIEKFRKNLKPGYKAFFSSLAKTQQPHTLFITCSDSRIDPNLITSTKPGELFIIRNVGNIIPPFGSNQTAEGAAIEYAVGVLGVKQIIVCGHSECGAMAQVLSGNIFTEENQKKFPSVAKWLTAIKDIKKHFKHRISSEQAIKLNVTLQLENLKTYPVVEEGLKQKTLTLQALFYNIGKADIELWDEMLGRYIDLDQHKKLFFGANLVKGFKIL